MALSTVVRQVEIVSPNQTSSSNNQPRPNRLCNGNDNSFKNNMRTNGYAEFNKACFVTPASGHFGNAGRGLIYGPGQDQVDFSMAKTFPIYEHANLELRGEFFNVFNHAQFSVPDASTGDAQFGVVTSARDPRIVQLSGRIVF